MPSMIEADLKVRLYVLLSRSRKVRLYVRALRP